MKSDKLEEAYMVLVDNVDENNNNNENNTKNVDKKKKSAGQKAVRKTLKGTGHLANLLPTGSVLAFQVISPVVTHKGQCPSSASRFITLAVLSCCAASCFLLSFTDSLRDCRGKVRYGLATPSGLWIIDSIEEVVEDTAEYRLRALDLVHAVASVLVFAAVAAFDQNVVRCVWPTPSEDAKELLVTLPLAVGLLCSLFFVAFPSKRHGIGFPLSRH